MTVGARAMSAAALHSVVKATGQVIQVRDGCGPHRWLARTAAAIGTAAGAAKPPDHGDRQFLARLVRAKLLWR
jgi:hypothetical protein